MFAKFFIKEWRDNRLILSLTGLILAALIIMGLAGRGKASFDIAAIILLCVLPVSALLLGSGAYGAEFRDNAWSYLFSRPIRKSTIWIYKYLALLSFLAAAFIVLNLAVAFLPGLKGVLQDFYAPSFFGNLIIYGLAIFLAFSISYSLSILSEKPLITFAVSVLTGALLFWLHVQSLQFLRERYAYWGNFAAMGLLVGASFILASVLTLTRIDFTQKAKKLFSFASLVLLFLALFFVAGTLIISKGHPFSNPRIAFWNSFKIQGNVYLGTLADRVIVYDSKADISRKMPGSVSDIDSFSFSSTGEKAVFIKIDRPWFGNQRAEACVANADGTAVTSLARFYGKDSAMNGWTPLSGILISADGRQAAFVAMPPGRGREKIPPRLFWMNTDGSGLRDRPLEFYRKGTVKLLSWLEDEKSLVLRLAEKDIHSLTVRIIKLNLDTGASHALETSFSYPTNYDWMPPSSLSPGKRSLIVRLGDQAQTKEKAMLLDLASFETKEIGADVPIWRLAWTRQGDKFAYFNFRDHILWVYSIADGSLQKAWVQPDKRVGLNYDWLEDGRRLIVVEGKEKEGFLTILSENFSPEKRIKIPDRIMQNNEYGLYIYGLENKVLVTSEENGAWRLDLKTDEWKKVY